MDIEIFQILGQLFDNATAAFVTSKAVAMMAALKPIAITGVTLYIVVYGYSALGGYVQEPFKQFIYKCVKIIIISAFAFNADLYLGQVVSAINGLQDGLAAVLGHSNANGIFGQLDKTLGKGFELMQVCLQKAADCSWTDFGTILLWYIVAGIVAFASIVVVLMGGMIVITASLLLKIMFALGPLFIMCLMFPMTAKFFDSWFSQVMNYTLKIALVAVVMAFATEIFGRIINVVDFDSDANSVVMALELIIAGYILYKVVLEVSNVASGLAGGVSMSVMSLGQLAAAAIAPYAVAKSTAATARNIVDPMTTRRDLESGMLVTARSSNHRFAGNTLANPAYRQHVTQNMFRNWGRAKGGKVSEK